MLSFRLDSRALPTARMLFRFLISTIGVRLLSHSAADVQVDVGIAAAVTFLHLAVETPIFGGSSRRITPIRLRLTGLDSSGLLTIYRAAAFPCG